MTDDPKLNPAPPASQDKRRSYRQLMGPIMMITVGVLFLIAQFTRYTFGDLWPVILIVAGGVTLAESLAARKSGTGS